MSWSYRSAKFAPLQKSLPLPQRRLDGGCVLFDLASVREGRITLGAVDGTIYRDTWSKELPQRAEISCCRVLPGDKENLAPYLSSTILK